MLFERWSNANVQSNMQLVTIGWGRKGRGRKMEKKKAAASHIIQNVCKLAKFNIFNLSLQVVEEWGENKDTTTDSFILMNSQPRCFTLCLSFIFFLLTLAVWPCCFPSPSSQQNTNGRPRLSQLFTDCLPKPSSVETVLIHSLKKQISRNFKKSSLVSVSI